PTSNGSGRVCAFHHSGRAGAERSEPSRSEVSAGRSRNGAPVGPGAFEDACWNPWLLRYEPPSEDGHSPTLAVRDLGGRFGNSRLSWFSAGPDIFQYSICSYRSNDYLSDFHV